LGYVLLLAIVAFGVPLAINLSARVNAEVRTQARAQVDLVAATAADLLTAKSRPELATLARSGAASVRGRILITNARGVVLADSNGPAEIGNSYASRPEVRAALHGRQAQVQRYSRTLGTQILATAAPIIHDGRPAGAVRVTQGVAAVQSAVRRAELGLVLIAAIVLALGLAAGIIIARQIAGPVQRLQRVARRVAGGDLAARAEVEGSLEQRSLAGSFNEMTERTSRLLSAQRQFVADASHQLRTPLTGLRLRLEEACAEVVGTSAERELEAGIAEVDRLSATVSQLLVLSAAGERRLEGAWVDLHDVAAVTTGRWRHHAHERSIALEHRRAARPGTVWAARGDLERILDVLLENAINYSPAHTAVEVSSFPDRIDVSDRGAGIDEDERDLVFERFRRGRAGRAGPPGSGLGLSMALELARAWDGAIHIAARDGGGTTVSLTLPRSPGPGAPTRSTGAWPALNSSARSLPGA
jgi:two-component system, OmpR family, sensor kinase